MAYQEQGKREIPRKSPTKFLCDLLEKESPALRSSTSENVRRWVIFGGSVRDKMIGLKDQDNDMDIGVIGETGTTITKILESHDRLRSIKYQITNTTYPVISIEADISNILKKIDFVNMAHPMFKICDFTVNNLMYVNTTMDINARVEIEGKTRHETLALCMSDIHQGLLRFMMPTEIPCSCRRHFVSTPRLVRSSYCDFKSKFSKSCVDCALVFLEQQLKLVERLNKMLEKTDPETGEKLFRLAEEPNFPPYYPEIIQKDTIQDNETCPICQEVFHKCDDVVITTCGHKYCASCMSSHVMTSTQLTEFGRKNSVSCPICREKVVLRTLCDSQVSLEATEED